MQHYCSYCRSPFPGLGVEHVAKSTLHTSGMKRHVRLAVTVKWGANLTAERRTKDAVLQCRFDDYPTFFSKVVQVVDTRIDGSDKACDDDDGSEAYSSAQ